MRLEKNQNCINETTVREVKVVQTVQNMEAAGVPLSKVQNPQTLT